MNKDIAALLSFQLVLSCNRFIYTRIQNKQAVLRLRIRLPTLGVTKTMFRDITMTGTKFGSDLIAAVKLMSDEKLDTLVDLIQQTRKATRKHVAGNGLERSEDN